MTEKITAEDFQKLRSKRVSKHKFGAIPCQRDGIKFPSKLERSYYDHLMTLKSRGEILYFLRQAPFHLPGNVRYVIDFVVFREFPVANGVSAVEVEYIDVKGKATATYRMKKKMVEDLYPIKITEIKKGDF